MTALDPRETHPDVIEHHREERLEPELFARIAESEAIRAGWAVSAIVRDADERVLERLEALE